MTSLFLSEILGKQEANRKRQLRPGGSDLARACYQGLNFAFSACVIISASGEFMARRSRTMPYGTVRWFNQKTGAGFIRTDDGENVLFLNCAIRDFDPNSICRGARVSLDVLKSKYGLTAVNVRAAELQEGRQ